MSDGTAESFYNHKLKRVASGIVRMWDWMGIFPLREVKAAIYSNIERLIMHRTFDDCSLPILKRRPVATIMSVLQKREV